MDDLLMYKDTQAIQNELNEMRPMVGEIFQKMMNFSKDITENYVLQFAKMQIELFNLIFDNLRYHGRAVSKYSNQDYANAVSNYKEFLGIIIDNLSAFGIEVVSSRLGAEFDGSIHDVIGSDDFSPRMSRVKKSVRPGFKYKDIIIQKEKIRVLGVKK